MKILFVCAGNTCRSPMAEALMQRRIMDNGLDHIQVSSAGTHVWPDDHAAADTVAILRERGIDIEGRPARQMDEGMARDADLILTMTQGVSQAVINLFPQITDKVMTLGDYADTGEDVDDPYGCDEEVYRATCAQIEEYLDILVQKLG